MYKYYNFEIVFYLELQKMFTNIKPLVYAIAKFYLIILTRRQKRLSFTSIEVTV